MKILVIAGSNSENSINRALASHAADVYKAEFNNDAAIEVLDLNDFEMPIYSGARETKDGIPALAESFRNKIGDADALIMSFAEHNGGMSAAFKNIFDWTSRIDQKVYQGKPVIFLSTSPGPGGAGNVLSVALSGAPHFAAEVKGSMSVPSFYDNFDGETGTLKNAEVAASLREVLKNL
jgi:NAD(P)H-dependent FMN reductase